MPLTLSGSNGVAGVDGSAGTPALQGSDSNTGISFASDVILGSTGGSERFRCDSSGRLLVGTSTASGNNLLQVNTDALIQGVTAGRGAGAVDTNTALGKSALASNTTGSQSVAIGSSSLTASTTGAANVAIGHSSMTAVTSGYNNTACGFNAMLSSTTAYYNVAAGADALRLNTTGNQNTAVGVDALRNNTTASNNVAVGLQALAANTSGANNSALGTTTLTSNTTGDNNTAIGRSALYGCTQGSSNSGIGFYGLVNLTTGSGNIELTSLTSGNAHSPLFNVTTENNRLMVGHGSITNAYAPVAWTITSDARDKTNFGDVPHGLNFVLQLHPVSFQYRENRDSEIPNGPVRYGFKAQDILALEGEDNAVIIDAEDPNKLRYNGETLVPVLVNAIQEQQAKIESLETRLAALEVTP